MRQIYCVDKECRLLPANQSGGGIQSDHIVSASTGGLIPDIVSTSIPIVKKKRKRRVQKGGGKKKKPIKKRVQVGGGSKKHCKCKKRNGRTKPRNVRRK